MTNELMNIFLQITGTIIGGAASMGGAWLTISQQFRNNKKDESQKKLIEAFSYARALFEETKLLIRIKPNLKNDENDPLGSWLRIAHNYDKILDRKKRATNEFYDQSDIEMASKLTLLCDLYTNVEMSDTAYNAYQAILGLASIYAQSNDENQLIQVYRQLDLISEGLLDLMKKLRKLIILK